MQQAEGQKTKCVVGGGKKRVCGAVLWGEVGARAARSQACLAVCCLKRGALCCSLLLGGPKGEGARGLRGVGDEGWASLLPTSAGAQLCRRAGASGGGGVCGRKLALCCLGQLCCVAVCGGLPLAASRRRGCVGGSGCRRSGLRHLNAQQGGKGDQRGRRTQQQQQQQRRRRRRQRQQEEPAGGRGGVGPGCLTGMSSYSTSDRL